MPIRRNRGLLSVAIPPAPSRNPHLPIKPEWLAAATIQKKAQTKRMDAKRDAIVYWKRLRNLMAWELFIISHSTPPHQKNANANKQGSKQAHQADLLAE